MPSSRVQTASTEPEFWWAGPCWSRWSLSDVKSHAGSELWSVAVLKLNLRFYSEKCVCLCASVDIRKLCVLVSLHRTRSFAVAKQGFYTIICDHALLLLIFIYAIFMFLFKENNWSHRLIFFRPCTNMQSGPVNVALFCFFVWWDFSGTTGMRNWLDSYLNASKLVFSSVW